MGKLTPKQSQIRSAWIGQRWEQAGQLRSEGSDDEFDRFLVGVRAEALRAEAVRIRAITDSDPANLWMNNDTAVGLEAQADLIEESAP